MNGGASQCDTFDYKPELIERHGQTFDPGSEVEAVTSAPGKVMKSPFELEAARPVRPVGQQRLPARGHVRRRPGLPDGDGVEDERPRPGQLHAEHRLRPARLPVHGRVDLATAWAASPTTCRRSSSCPTRAACRTTTPATSPRASCRSRTRGRSSRPPPRCRSPTCSRPSRPGTSRPRARPTAWPCSRRLNREHMTRSPGDSRLEARIASYELAARMQLSAPEVLDLSGETRGDARALRPRRQGHRGLRPQLPDRAAAARARRPLRAGLERRRRRRPGNWDNHGDIDKELRVDRREHRQAGRRPAQGPQGARPARGHAGHLDHRVRPDAVQPGRARAATTTAAPSSPGSPAAASKGGVAYGESDEWSWKARHPTYCYDLHATILHLLGIDHERLTFRHNGIDRRLTDVHGHVITEILRSSSSS